MALFDEVLRVRITHNGELAPECASAYYRYGAALLYQAQEASDVLGAPLGGEGDGEDAGGAWAVQGGGWADTAGRGLAAQFSRV